MNAYFPFAILQWFYRNGIIKVLGIIRIDGESNYIPKVPAPGNFRWRYLYRDIFGLPDHLVGKAGKKSIVQQYGLHFQVSGVFTFQHFQYTSHRVGSPKGPVIQVDQYFVAILCSIEIICGNIEMHMDALVIWDYPVMWPGLFQHSNELLPLSFKYFYNDTFMPASAAQVDPAYPDAVAIQGVLYIFRGNIDVFAPLPHQHVSCPISGDFYYAVKFLSCGNESGRGLLETIFFPLPG